MTHRVADLRVSREAVRVAVVAVGTAALDRRDPITVLVAAGLAAAHRGLEALALAGGLAGDAAGGVRGRTGRIAGLRAVAEDPVVAAPRGALAAAVGATGPVVTASGR